MFLNRFVLGTLCVCMIKEVSVSNQLSAVLYVNLVQNNIKTFNPLIGNVNTLGAYNIQFWTVVIQ